MGSLGLCSVKAGVINVGIALVRAKSNNKKFLTMLAITCRKCDGNLLELDHKTILNDRMKVNLWQYLPESSNCWHIIATSGNRQDRFCSQID